MSPATAVTRSAYASRLAARRLERRGEALGGPVVVLGADQRDHVAVGALEHAREHLHADEAGRAGQQ